MTTLSVDIGDAWMKMTLRLDSSGNACLDHIAAHTCAAERAGAIHASLVGQQSC